MTVRLYDESKPCILYKMKRNSISTLYNHYTKFYQFDHLHIQDLNCFGINKTYHMSQLHISYIVFEFF